MRLLDVNILVYAHRRDADQHEEYRNWVEAMVNSTEPYAVSDAALTGMIRVVTSPRIYQRPSTIDQALSFAAEIRGQPHAHLVAPGTRFWRIFDGLCRRVKAHGTLVPDAYLAALAVEHGCELISADSDFRRFPGLRWRHPLA